MLNRFIFILLIIIPALGFTAEITFHKDSLSAKAKSEQNNQLHKIPVEILKGIVAGDYKKLGWNEYVPKDGLEFPDIPLPSVRHHPTLARVVERTDTIDLRRHRFLCVCQRRCSFRSDRKLIAKSDHSTLTPFGHC